VAPVCKVKLAKRSMVQIINATEVSIMSLKACTEKLNFIQGDSQDDGLEDNTSFQSVDESYGPPLS